ncbi:phosphotransferase family protein [Nocardioides sp. cx-173]|uniref:phosphotransferase family protein n=1 Tax=Nocardioides sp. cx-173 TaxID=2898796 RepID=UPI001E5B7B01|nr:phosphotransferase family protein [Nocardioides sp. cx-173]MCD4524264.1 phosphotransferase family protein [Nocardioides sp. cx-173]UGB41656.1 phosphotransferase family protein [Nocardioides sp. cx-173]
MAQRQVDRVDETMVEQLRTRVAASVAQWRAGSRLTRLEPLTGGTSSLTFVMEVVGPAGDTTPAVLKVAPPGLEPVRNRDVLRQARLQRSLEGSERPIAPALFFSEPGLSLDEPPYLAMELVAGDCVEPTLTDEALPAAQVQARELDAVGVLAALHAIVPDRVGLAAEPVTQLSAEVERWIKAFTTLPVQMQGDYERAGQLLLDTAPEALPPVINHGDYRLGNALCAGDRVNAVIDWEIWSVGDPRVDLSWMAYFLDDADHPAVVPGWHAGTLSRGELVSAYESAAGRTMPAMDWFHALTRFKEASITGLLIKRADKLNRPLIPSMERMRPALPRLVQETIELIG